MFSKTDFLKVTKSRFLAKDFFNRIHYSFKFAFHLYPCDKQGYCNRLLDSFPINRFVHRTRPESSLVTFFHNLVKFLSVFGRFSPQLTNVPGTAKVRSSNLTRACFFSNWKSVSNKFVGQLFVCLSVVGLVVTSWNFFCYAYFFMLPLVFDLLLQFVILLALTTYFLCFLFR